MEKSINKFFSLDWACWASVWFLAILCFRLSLDYIYVDFVLDEIGDGFPYTFNTWRIFESWVALFLMAELTPRKARQPSDFLVLMLFVLCMVSVTSYYALGGGARIWFWALVFQFVLFRFVVLYGVNTLNFSVNRPSNDSRYALAIIFVVLALAIYKVWETGALRLLDLSLNDLYDRRELAASFLKSGAWAYIFSWAPKVVAVYLLIYGIWRRRLWLAGLGGASVLLFFGVLAHKAMLFAALFAVFVYFSWPLVSRGFSLVVLAIFIMLVGFYPLSDLLGTTLYQDIFSRRLFFTPARLDFLYYDFFVSREPLLFSNSFMSGFIDYPFDKAYPYIIGDFSKMGGPDTAANNGFLATGYMHLGWLGVVLYPTVVAVLVVLVNWVSAEKSKAVVAAVCFYPFAALFTSSDLPTAILTHGIGLLLLILWLDGSRVEGESGRD